MFPPISNRDDILEIEQHGLSHWLKLGTTYELISESAEKFTDKVAIRHLPNLCTQTKATELTYQGLFSKVTQAANAFCEISGTEPLIVSILLPNLPETHIALWGAEAVGIANPINHYLEPEQIAHIIRAASSKSLVVLGPHEDFDIWEKTPAILELLPGQIEQIFVVTGHSRAQRDALERPGTNALKGITIRTFDEALAAQDSSALRIKQLSKATDVASYFHTGGTTGLPKLAQHTHENETYQAHILGALLELSPADNGLGALPLFHVNGVIVTGLAPFAYGATVTIATPRGFRNPAVIKSFWSLVASHKISYVSAVPTIYSALLKIGQEGHDLSSLRFGICGAAPISVATFTEFQETTGIRLLEAYGLTEGGCGSSINPLRGQQKIGSIGLRFPFQEMKVARLDDAANVEEECKPNEPGSILIRGPNVFPGYLDANANKGTLVSDGWLATGDLGHQDEDGYFWLAGRSKDVIIRGGHNIDPKAIEEVMERHSGVAQCAAVAEPDAYAGELPVAFVQLTEDVDTTQAELMDYSRKNMPERAAIPVKLHIVPNMPTTAVGKIFKPELRRRAAEHKLQEVLAEQDLSHLRISVENNPKGRDKVMVSKASETEFAQATEVFSAYPYDVFKSEG